MSSLLWLLGFIIIVFVVKFLIVNKMIIRIETFFRKGFQLKHDVFGAYCFTRQTTALGKTLSCCDYILSTRKDKKVICNVKSFCDTHKDFCIYNDNFFDIIDKFTSGVYDSNYIIFYDEIFTLLEKGKLPKNILSFISQLRKRNIILITTAQEWLEINVTYRRYVRYQIDCSMLNLPFIGAICINHVRDGYQMKWSNEENDYVAPTIRTTVKKASKEIADSYDTFEVIKDLDPVSYKRKDLKYNVC